MAITVTTVATGFAVRIPFELKDSFKGVFKSARWDADSKAWLVGERAEKRLEQWISVVQPIVDELDAHYEAELTEKELARIEHSTALLRIELATTLADTNDLEHTKALLSSANEELEHLRQEMLSEKKRHSQARQDAMSVLNSVCDMDRVALSHKMMIKHHNTLGRNSRIAFNEAATVIGEQHSKLLAAGYRCAGMEALSYMNFNRPDRDIPANVSLKDLLTVERVTE